MNATAKVVSLRDATEPTDTSDSLLREREAILAELARLAAINGPVRDAEAAVAAVTRAIDALDADERSRSEEWAANGVGAPPQPRTAERRSLIARRIELESDVASARNRAAAIVPRQTALNGEVRRIDHLIFAAKLRAAVEEVRRLDARAHELAAEMREPIGRVVALKLALVRRQDSDNPAEQRLIGETIDVLNGFKMPDLGGDPARLEGFIASWGESLR